MKKKTEYIRLLFVMLIVLMFYIFLGFKDKETMHFDEYFSYGSSNQFESNSLKVPEGVWCDNQLFVNYLSVDENHRWDYSSVWKNQAADVHPPLYYALMNTVCSFFPGVFSKWFGLGINVTCIMVGMIILYEIALMLWEGAEDSKISALLTIFIYGISMSTINLFLFLRMYCLLQVCILLSLYIHFWGMNMRRFNVKVYLLIGLCSVIGTLTHYYFLLFDLLLSICFGIYLLIGKRWKETCFYCLTMCAAGIISVLIYPAMIEHIFKGYRGKAVLDNLTNTTKWYQNINTMYINLMDSVYGHWIIGSLVLVTIAIFFLKWVLHRKRGNDYNAVETYVIRLSFIGAIIIGYFLIMTKASPMQLDRYYAPIFPLLILLTIYILEKLGLHIINNLKIVILVLGVFLSVSTIRYFCSGSNTVEMSSLEIARQYSGEDSLYILYNDDWTAGYTVLNNYDKIKNFKGTYYMYGANLKPISDERLLNEDELIVFILPSDGVEGEEGNNVEDVIEYVMENTGLTEYKLLYGTTYFFSKDI